MHMAHDPGYNRTVPHTRIEYPQSGRLRVNMSEFHAGPVRNDPLLTAGIDEHEIFLAIIVKPESRLRIRGSRRLLIPYGL